MKNLVLTFAAAGLLLYQDGHGQITAAVAANVKFAMEELKAAFRKESGIEVKTVYGSSGKLATQIRHGAPFDVFISADMGFPDSLAAWGHAGQKPKAYAYGKLVLWTVKDLDLARGMALLEDSSVGAIAVADPKRAPYGAEAIKAMRKSGVHDKVSGKLVFGESVAQVGQYITTGNAAIGFNAKSIVLSDEMQGLGKWVEVDGDLYDPIAQGAVICKYGLDHNPRLSRRFFDFLYSDAARLILKRYGYDLPSPRP